MSNHFYPDWAQSSEFSNLPDAEIKIFRPDNLPTEMATTGGVIFDITANVVSLSGNIPENYRRYVMRHEVVCIPGHQKGESWHCFRATEYELNLVPMTERWEYIQWRIWFFENLITYMRNNPNERNNHFIIELQSSVDKLQLEKARISPPTWEFMSSHNL
jgi:hypothetical protein